MGENGAGKSTLIKALTGVYGIDSGRVVVDGTERRLSGTADAQAAGISTVYQEVNLCGNLTIGENVMLGHERRGRFGIDWKGTHAAASEVLARVGLGHLDPRTPLSTISLALQQLVAISRATVLDAKVLILDEPTSSLDADEVEGLFRVMRRLRDEGVAILFVSHFLDQVFAISDRLTVLRNGRLVGEHLTRDIDRAGLIAEMIGRTCRPSAPSTASAPRARSPRASPCTGPPASAGRARSTRPTSSSAAARSWASPGSSAPAAPSSRASSTASTSPTPDP